MVLKKEILELAQLITFSDKIKTSISDVGADWHIDHSLKVILSAYNALKKSKPENYKWTFNLLKRYIFSKGSIPRGRRKTSKIVVVKNKIHQNNLNEQLLKVKKLLKEIETLPPESHFKHPYFGLLNLKDSLRFLKIHTEHHLKIIRDIIDE